MTFYSSPDDWDVSQTEKRRRVVHANDGSESSFRALEVAFVRAESWSASLRIMLLSDPLPQADSLFEVRLEEKRAERRLEQLRQRVESTAARFSVPHRTYNFRGHPVRHILQFVKETNADLLVIGATPARGLFDLIAGPRSKRIARRAACPVLIVR